MKSIVLAALAVALPHATARAQAPGEVTPAEAPAAADDEVDHYGTSLALADLTMLGLTIAGGASDSPGMAAFGGVGLFLASPIVHAAHGNPGRALASVTLRAGLLTVGAAIGASACDESCRSGGEDSGGDLEAIVLGGLAGFATAVVVDYVVLGHARRDRPRTREQRSIAPTVAATGDRLVIGVAGGF